MEAVVLPVHCMMPDVAVANQITARVREEKKALESDWLLAMSRSWIFRSKFNADQQNWKNYNSEKRKRCIAAYNCNCSVHSYIVCTFYMHTYTHIASSPGSS